MLRRGRLFARMHHRIARRQRVEPGADELRQQILFGRRQLLLGLRHHRHRLPPAREIRVVPKAGIKFEVQH